MTGEPALASKIETPPVRELPHSLEAEKAYLGAVFIDNRVLEDTIDFLRPEHFAYGPHGLIFEAAVRLRERGRAADPITLSRFFEAQDSAGDIGGRAYLNDLAHSAVTPLTAKEYAGVIFDYWQKRELIQSAEAMIQGAYGDTAPASELLEVHEAEISRLAEADYARTGPVPVSGLIPGTIESIERARLSEGPVGLTTGLRDLDRFTGGLMPSDLIILAARPGMGKTALALVCACRNALAGIPVAFFSLEMSAEQMMMRLLAMETGVSAKAMRTGEIGEPESGLIRGASENLISLPITIDDRGNIPAPYIRARAKGLKRKGQCGLVIVDYLGLIRPDDRYRGQRVNEVSEMTSAFKALAKELEVPVLLLAQLNRALENRDDKRPRLSDLRDSGSIEQDADIVKFLYREEYYIEQEGEPVQRAGEEAGDFADRLADWQTRKSKAKGKAEIIVAKMRNGPTGVRHAYFDEIRTSFGDPARNNENEEMF